MTSARKYGSISFAESLAGQEFPIKIAALSRLHEYFKHVNLNVGNMTFWKQVETFENETEGLHVATHQEILRVDIPHEFKEDIERLGFYVGATRSALVNDF